ELLPLAARRFAQVVGERERAAALLAALDCEGYVLARWSVDAIVECERQLAIRLALQIDRRRALQCQCPELRARPRREPRVLLGGTVNGGNGERTGGDRKSTRLNSSHVKNSYAVFCLHKQNGHPTTETGDAAGYF